MDHQICLNTNSFPAESADKAYQLFNDSLQGMLKLNDGDDRFILYLDNEASLDSFILADNYTYADFITQLFAGNEDDMYLFLLELEDKSPALNFVDDATVEEMSDYDFYIKGYPVSENGEVFSLAYFLSATLLSINTAEQWSCERLSIARIEEGGRYIDEELTLNNISCLDHGTSLYEEFKHVDIKKICENCDMSEEFIEWYKELDTNNQYRVVDKYRLAVERKFDGGEPLFKTLADTNGMREIRFSAYAGGAIRVLFKRFSVDETARYAILFGFIKKSDNEGYAENIPKAGEIFERLVAE